MTDTILPILRRSAIQTATSCLYRYKKVWLEGVPDESDFALRGIGFHACSHRYIGRLVELNLTADAEEAQAAFIDGIGSALTPSHLVAEVREIFARWAERFQLELEYFVAAEEHQIGKSGQVFTPDLVYARPEALEIIDWKTYWSGLTEEQIRKDFQARFYIYNAMRIWPNFPVYRFTHSYVRYGTSVSVDFTADDLAGFQDEVTAVAETITQATDRNEWPATAGAECAFCQLACPLADHPAVVPKRFTVPQQAQEVAGWILAAETMVKTAKKALKAYCSANGSVVVGNVVFDNRPVVQRTYPIGDALRVLKERNVLGAFDGDGGLTISHSALSKLIKRFPQLSDDLKPFVSEKVTWRFSARKPEQLEAGDDDE